MPRYETITLPEGDIEPWSPVRVYNGAGELVRVISKQSLRMRAFRHGIVDAEGYMNKARQQFLGFPVPRSNKRSTKRKQERIPS
jgi:hypothetical protein